MCPRIDRQISVFKKKTLPQIRVVAAYAGLVFDAPESYTHMVDNHKPEFRAKFPHGKIPAFEGKDGFCLVEGSVIARYCESFSPLSYSSCFNHLLCLVAALAPNSGLLGNNIRDTALIDQWVHLAESEVGDNTIRIFHLLKGHIAPYSKPVSHIYLFTSYSPITLPLGLVAHKVVRDRTTSHRNSRPTPSHSYLLCRRTHHSRRSHHSSIHPIRSLGHH
jgi:hypothetical protein